MTETPEPTETGSAGTQEIGTPASLSVNQQSPLEGLPITRTVEGLAATHSRSMGGEVAANLLAGAFTQITHDLQETKQDLDSTQKKLEMTHEELSDYKTKTAVLQERVNITHKNRHLKNLSMTAGTILIALGVDLYRNDFDKSAYILGALGMLFILLGWFSKEGSAEI